MSLRGRHTGAKSSQSNSLYNPPPPVPKPSQPLKKQAGVQQPTNAAPIQKLITNPSKPVLQSSSIRSNVPPSSLSPLHTPIQSENLPTPLASSSSRLTAPLSLATTPPSSSSTPFSSQDPPGLRRALTTTNQSFATNNNEINAPFTPTGGLVPMGIDQYINTHPFWNYRLSPLNIQSKATSHVSTTSSAHAMFTPISIDPSVKVVLRVRPPNKSEVQQSQGPKLNSNSNSIIQNQDEVFTSLSSHSATPSAQHCNQRFNFDLVLSPAHHQSDVFDQVGKPMLSAFLQGYNTTMFVYGQSGSGKTHTIYGSVPSSINDTAPVNTPNFEAGIIPNSLRHIYQQLNEASQSVSNHPDTPNAANIPKSFQWKTYCSLLEVYNDRIYDLFEISTTKSSQDAEKNPQTVETTNDNECLHLLQDGLKKRKVASTLLNSSSSRSHLVFILYLSTTTTTSTGATIIHNSKLTLIDLAGSERVRKSGVLSEHLGGNSEQLDEATHINTSLTHLSTVISKLNANNESGQKTFVPYRNSALTRLLRDSLGGNSVTCVIACVSPSKIQEQETVGTIRFAQGARKITNAVALNEIKRQETARELSDMDKQRLLDYENNIILNKQQHQKMLGVMQVLLAQRDRFKDIILGAKFLSRPLEAGEDGALEAQHGDKDPMIAARDVLAYFASTKLDTLLTLNNDLFDENGGVSEVIQQSEITGLHYDEFLELFNPNQTQPNLSYGVPDPMVLFDMTKNVINDIIAQGIQLDNLAESQSNFLLEFQLTKLQQEYSNLQETHGMLIADYKSACAEITQKDGEIDKLHNDVANQAKVIAVQETTITSLENELQQVIKENQHHLLVISDLEASMATLQAQLRALEIDFATKVTECANLTEDLGKKDETIQRCEKKINKLVDGIKQVMTHNKVLEAEIVTHQQTISDHVQTIEVHKTSMVSLQDMHNKYVSELQETHQTINSQQLDQISALSGQVAEQTDHIHNLSSRVEETESTITTLESYSTQLQAEFTGQAADLQHSQTTNHQLTLTVANLEQQLAEAKKESEQLFNINLSLSSHNNDHQKIKMQEILRERLKTAENKLREKELAYDELHQKHYVQFQRNKLMNSEIRKPTTTTTAATPALVKELTTTSAPTSIYREPKDIALMPKDSRESKPSTKALIGNEPDQITTSSSTDGLILDHLPSSYLAAPSSNTSSTSLERQLSTENLHESFTSSSSLPQPSPHAGSFPTHSSLPSSSSTSTAPLNTSTISSTATQPTLNRLPTTTQIPQRNIPTKSLKHKQPIGK